MPIRVAFLTFYHESWDALDDIYRLMRADERFEPVVISIPRRLTGDAGFGHEWETSNFLTDAGIEHLRFENTDDDGKSGLAQLRQLEPDYVFLNYPWRRNYQPLLRAEKLVEFTRIAYVPYFSLPLVNEPGETGVAPHLYEQRTHQLASLIFTQDQAAVDAFAHTDRGNAHVILTGTPKLDVLAREAKAAVSNWPIEASRPEPGQTPGPRKFRIVWAPHHSYSQSWLNFGTFVSNYKQMLHFATSHPDVDIVLRPHPFLFGTLLDRKLVDGVELGNWLEDWNDLSNTAIHTEGSYASLFMATDLMVTDGISFLGEYPLLTGRPTIFIERSDHWEFAPLGELAAACNIRVSNFEGFEAAFDEIRTEGMPDFSEPIAKLRAAASPYPGQVAQRILEAVAEDFAAGSKLVDPAVVKTLAWEFREGREPQLD